MKDKIDLRGMASEENYIDYVISCYKEVETDWLRVQPSCLLSHNILQVSLMRINQVLNTYFVDYEARSSAQKKADTSDANSKPMDNPERRAEDVVSAINLVSVPSIQSSVIKHGS